MGKKGVIQEVEIRALLKPDQSKSILAQLIKLGATPSKPEQLKDIYFCPVKVKSFKEIEMNKVGSYSLRLRKRVVNKKTFTDLNIKVITHYGDHNSWQEHEVEVADMDEAKKILLAIGFKDYFTVEKARYPYKLGKINVLLEDIKNFGPIIEIEILTDKNKADSAKVNIKKLLSKLGISDDQLVSKSVTNLLMKKLAELI